jgi:hypothetical protein
MKRSIQCLLILFVNMILSPTFHAKKIKVAIINFTDAHHEVYPAFHYAWEKAGFEVETFANYGAKRNMRAITSEWKFSTRDTLKLNRKDPELNAYCSFDLVIFTSIELPHDRDYAMGILQAPCASRQRFAFVVHNAEALAAKVIPLLKASPSAVVIGLAPHVATQLRGTLRDAGLSNSVEYIIPTFPVDTRKFSQERKGFILQGNLHSHRRNYTDLINGLLANHKDYPADFHVSLLGSGPLSLIIPLEVQSFLSMRRNLPYPEYYGAISSSLGLLTSFASMDYLRSKSSSSVAASLICRTPLLIDSSVLTVYSYLSVTSVWLIEPDETEAAAMARILKMPYLQIELEDRYQSLIRDATLAIENNVNVANRIMRGVALYI